MVFFFHFRLRLDLLDLKLSLLKGSNYFYGLYVPEQVMACTLLEVELYYFEFLFSPAPHEFFLCHYPVSKRGPSGL